MSMRLTMKSLKMLILAAAILCGGCEHIMQSEAVKPALTEQDHGVIAGMLAALVSDHLPPRKQPRIQLAAGNNIRKLDAMAVIDESITNLLKLRGYQLADNGKGQVTTAATLRYELYSYGSGYVLQINLNGMRAATYLHAHSGGVLTSAAPLTIRERRS